MKPGRRRWKLRVFCIPSTSGLLQLISVWVLLQRGLVLYQASNVSDHQHVARLFPRPDELNKLRLSVSRLISLSF